MIFFFLHCAPKSQAVVVTTLRFISQRRVSYIFHAIYLFNNNKYIRSLLQSYITVNFGKIKERKGSIRKQYLILRYIIILDFDYVSQSITKTVIFVLINSQVKTKFEHGLTSVAFNIQKENVKPGLNKIKRYR